MCDERPSENDVVRMLGASQLDRVVRSNDRD
jgi:hypothetical protein